MTRIWVLIAAFVYLLLVGVGVIGDGFKWISGGADGAQRIFSFASNPIVSVILGTLATALVQSSSTVTSVIVALVAGGMPISIAVPMIMGANMGTTITNTIVSLGNVGQRSMFNKSFQAATVHDFFNLYSIVIFLPIEMMFHPLERLGEVMAGWFVDGTSASVSGLNVIGAATKPVAAFIVDGLHIFPTSIGALLAITIGISFVITSVLYLGKLLRAVMTGKAMNIVHGAVGGGPIRGIATGDRSYRARAVIIDHYQFNSATCWHGRLDDAPGVSVHNGRQHRYLHYRAISCYLYLGTDTSSRAADCARAFLVQRFSACWSSCTRLCSRICLSGRPCGLATR